MVSGLRWRDLYIAFLVIGLLTSLGMSEVSAGGSNQEGCSDEEKAVWDAQHTYCPKECTTDDNEVEEGLYERCPVLPSGEDAPEYGLQCKLSGCSDWYNSLTDRDYECSPLTWAFDLETVKLISGLISASCYVGEGCSSEALIADRLNSTVIQMHCPRTCNSPGEANLDEYGSVIRQCFPGENPYGTASECLDGTCVDFLANITAADFACNAWITSEMYDPFFSYLKNVCSPTCGGAFVKTAAISGSCYKDCKSPFSGEMNATLPVCAPDANGHYNEFGSNCRVNELCHETASNMTLEDALCLRNAYGEGQANVVDLLEGYSYIGQMCDPDDVCYGGPAYLKKWEEFDTYCPRECTTNEAELIFGVLRLCEPGEQEFGPTCVQTGCSTFVTQFNQSHIDCLSPAVSETISLDQFEPIRYMCDSTCQPLLKKFHDLERLCPRDCEGEDCEHGKKCATAECVNAINEIQDMDTLERDDMATCLEGQLYGSNYTFSDTYMDHYFNYLSTACDKSNPCQPYLNLFSIWDRFCPPDCTHDVDDVTAELPLCDFQQTDGYLENNTWAGTSTTHLKYGTKCKASPLCAHFAEKATSEEAARCHPYIISGESTFSEVMTLGATIRDRCDPSLELAPSEEQVSESAVGFLMRLAGQPGTAGVNAGSEGAIKETFEALLGISGSDVTLTFGASATYTDASSSRRKLQGGPTGQAQTSTPITDVGVVIEAGNSTRANTIGGEVQVETGAGDLTESLLNNGVPVQSVGIENMVVGQYLYNGITGFWDAFGATMAFSLYIQNQVIPAALLPATLLCNAYCDDECGSWPRKCINEPGKCECGWEDSFWGMLAALIFIFLVVVFTIIYKCCCAARPRAGTKSVEMQ